MNSKDIIRRMVDKFDETIDLYGIDRTELYNNGTIYYQNGNDGTSFDWGCNNMTSEFFVFWKESEMGFMKLNVYKDGEICGYVWLENGYGKGEKIACESITPKEALMFKNYIYSKADAKYLYNKSLEELNINVEKTFVYSTNFQLTDKVNNYAVARQYLEEYTELVTGFIKTDDRVFDKNFKKYANAVVELKWNLIDEQNGVITFKTSKPFPDELLDKVSKYIRGQNSDGLGEGFEQRDFASYCDTEVMQLDAYEEEDEEGNIVYYDQNGYEIDESLIDRNGYYYEEINIEHSAQFDWDINDYKLSLLDESKELETLFNALVEQQTNEENAWDLAGVNGNAFSLIAYSNKALRSVGLNSKKDELFADATSSNYQHVVQVCASAVDKANDQHKANIIFRKMANAFGQQKASKFLADKSFGESKASYLLTSDFKDSAFVKKEHNKVNDYER